MSDVANPLVSVIIPTWNRKVLLREAIETIWKQTLDPSKYELIIIDNRSTDGTGEMMKQLIPQSPCTLRYIVMDQNRGCFNSINHGVMQSRANIVASTDSDCWADPKWLENGVAPFLENPDLAFVSGHMADKPTQQVTFFSVRNGAPEEENLFYPSGNIFYNRRLYLEFGGCAEDLSFGDVGTSPIGCGDSDLAWRMKEAGHPYAYRRDAVVYHEVFQVPPMLWLKIHTRMLVMPELVRRHPALRKVLFMGMFYFKDNILFYVAALSLLAVLLIGPWALLGAVPYLLRLISLPGRGWGILHLLKLPARVGLLAARQSVICGSLVYGSFRARTLVL